MPKIKENPYIKNLRMNWYYSHSCPSPEMDKEGNYTGKETSEKHFSIFLVKYLFQGLRLQVGKVICHFFGHGKHYQCEDWGGPESGGMAGSCSRCGFSFHHILY